MYKIRKAKKDDAKIIAALGVQVWLETYANNGIKPKFLDYLFDRFQVKDWEKIIESPEHVVLVSIAEDGICGFLRVNLKSPCSINSSFTAELDPIYIMGSQKGKGLGKLLLNNLNTELQSLKIHDYWFTVWIGNKSAISFYKHLGFNQIGETFFEGLENESHENLVFQGHVPTLVKKNKH